MPAVPAVFVHGVPERPGIWDDLRSHLGRDDHIAVALPAFESPVLDGFTCTMDDYARWLTAGVEAACARVASRAGAEHEVLPSLGHWWLLQDPTERRLATGTFWNEVA